MKLSGKKILVLSPHSWGGMLISKHHYAIELARKGNSVFFLNPANHNQKKYLKIEPHPEVSNLNIISYRPFLPYFLRFHFRSIFDFLMRYEVRFLMNKLNVKWDVLWDFEIGFYADLSLFKATKIILHPVDVIPQNNRVAIGRKADVIISVSMSILNKFESLEKPMHWINHGLAREFTEMAGKPPGDYVPSGKIKAGYVGNLFNGTIDKDIILSLIEKHRNVEFHFVGPTEFNQNNLGGEHEHGALFVDALRREPNVKLWGVLPTSQLADFLSKMDLFLLCYFKAEGVYDLSNSHKILEYLSSGKVIVCRYVSIYSNHKDLIQMTNEESSTNDFIELFSTTVSKLEMFNSLDLQLKRKMLALENSYVKQIERIEAILPD